MTDPYARPYAGQPYGAAYAPPRRRARWPWVLLVVVIVLAGLFVVADRVALALAEDKAADSLQSSQHLDSKPDVTVTGFPFLTQLLERKFGQIDVDAHDVTVGKGLRIEDVRAQLHDVTVSSDYSSFQVDTADVVAQIGFADLGKALGVAVRYGGGGRLVAEPSVTVLGHKFTAELSAVVHASTADGLSFGDPRISAGGVQLPSLAAKAIAAVFEQVISLDGLPFGVRVDSTTVTRTGVQLDLSGENLSYSRGS